MIYILENIVRPAKAQRHLNEAMAYIENNSPTTYSGDIDITIGPAKKSSSWKGYARPASRIPHSPQIDISLGRKQKGTIDLQKTSAGRRFQYLEGDLYLIKAMVHELLHIMRPKMSHEDIRLYSYLAVKNYKKRHMIRTRLRNYPMALIRSAFFAIT